LSYIYLVRHGKADSTGETYDRLTELGHDQANRFARYMNQIGVEPTRIYSGTMRRQMETAEPLVKSARGPSLVSTAALNEFAPAFWQGMAAHLASGDAHFAVDLKRYSLLRTRGGRRSLALFLRLTQQIFQAWFAGVTPEGTESFVEFEKRVLDFLGIISDGKKNECIFVFSSGTPLSIMLARFLQWDRTRSFDWIRWLYNTSLTIINAENGVFRPVTMNSLPHLPDPGLHTLL